MIYQNAEVFLEGHFVKADIIVESGIITGIYRENDTIREGQANAQISAEVISGEVNGKIPGKQDNGENQEMKGSEVVDCDGMYIIPGIVDIHTHGCTGHDFSFADPQALSEMTGYYYENGITHVLATTMTNEKASLSASVKAIGEYMKNQEQGHATIEGIYMEGPFFRPEKKGAHDEKFLMPLDENYLHDFDKESGSNIKVVAFDPCLQGAEAFVKKYKDRYILSIAHTACDYDTATNVMELGALHVTHLYNAMNDFDKRSPGIVGAFLDKPECYAEIICDGIHIHPSVLRAMFRLCPDRMVAISDSMSATGLADGTYSLGGQKVYVKASKAVLADGTIAGSATNLFSMMKKLIEYGVEPEAAVAAVTINPARSVHLDHLCGCIRTGRKADFIVVDKQYNIVGRANRVL